MGAIATVYKGLSNKPQVVELPAGKTLAQAFPNENLSRAACFVNNKWADADYALKEGDSVFVRLMPGTKMDTAGWIILSVFTLGIGAIVWAGVSLYKQKKELEALQDELESLQSASGSDIDNRPFLRGSSNTAATSKTQPYICGRHLFTPYLLADTFYELTGTDGEDQYANIILEGGFNKQIIDTVGCDDITILSRSDASPQEGTFSCNSSSVFASGTVEIAQDGELLTSNSALNYKHVVTTCNEEVPRTSDISSGDAEDYIFTLDEHAKDVEVCISFSSGLYAYDSDGNKTNTSVTITPQYSLDGGSSWTSFTFYNSYTGSNSNTFSRNTSTKELRYTAKKTFSLSDYKTLYNNGQSVIYCRLRSSGANDTQIRNTCYILYYQSLCFDPNTSSSPAGSLDDNGAAGLASCLVLNERERKKSTIIGVRLKATSSNEDKLSKIFVITSGIARTWDGSAWSTEKTATRNPAAWALEILTSDTHALSRFDDDEIDLESFGEWYEFCEENDFYFDYVISSKTKKETVLEYITSSCRAVLYTDIYGRKAVAIDRPQENAVAIYNPQNIISIENEREFARRTDCVRVTWTNSEDDLFEEDTYTVMREVDGEALELDEDTVITDLTTSGITTYEHVVKYARYMMACEILRPKITTIEVGNEGIFYAPYAKVLLQDDSLKIGTGSAVVKGVAWEGGVAVSLILKNPVTVEEGKSYGVIIECFTEEGTARLCLKVAADPGDDVTVLDILTELKSDAAAIPEGGEVLSFGELDDDGEFTRITTPYLISGISRTDSGFSLELVNYDEAVYDTGTIPDYTSNITQRPAKSSAEIPDDFISRDELYEAVKNAVAAVADGTTSKVGEPDVPSALAAVADEAGIALSCVLGLVGLANDIATVTFEITKHDGTVVEVSSSEASARYSFNRSTDGYIEAEALGAWQVRAKACNIYSKESEWSDYVSLDLSDYLTWKAPPVAVEYCTAKQDGIYAEWACESALTYGTLRFRYTLSYNGEAIAEKDGILLSSYTYSFNRSSDKDGYPETHSVTALLEDLGVATAGRDLSLYSVKVEAYTLEASDYAEEAAATPDATYYGTWVPADISSVTATAGRDSIEAETSVYPSASNWGTPYSYIVQVSKDGGNIWSEYACASSSFIYTFDRVQDGYPEAEDLSSWRVRVKAVSTAGLASMYWGGSSAGVAVGTDSYGTWAVSSPDVNVAVSGRAVTLTMSQPALATGRERYGTFYNRLQIQKPSESSEWFKPAVNLDPYADEDNWRDGEGYVVAESVYTQTMPLTGQTLQTVEVEGETVQQSAPEATLYRFRIEAYSEAGEADAIEVNATALATGIQDIVQGSVTSDKISTPSLSAICANMGVITSGGFTGSELNYWALSSILGMSSQGIADMYEGAFRVGGEDEYLVVEPQVAGGAVTGYKMRFKAGAFEITTEATTVNGEVIVQAAEDALDRTRITPTGTYFEHRLSSDSEDWEAVSRVRVDGVKTGLLRSDGHLVITNLGIAERRLLGHDIGRAYLSDSARVWHFDTDFLDQNQREGLAIEGSAELVDAETYSDSSLDFTPAILAVAPYAEDVKVAYGQFAASITLSASNAVTVDFWIQYIWNENQTLFDIGNVADGLRLVVQNDEPYWNGFEEERDAVPFNAEILEEGDVVVWNEPEEADSYIQHYGSGHSAEDIPLGSLSIKFESNTWLHVAVVISEEAVSAFLGSERADFARFAQAAEAVGVTLNGQAGTFILDELYIDEEAAESFEAFCEGTEARAPWGALDDTKKHFVLDGEELATNIFESDAFKSAVKAIINEQ